MDLILIKLTFNSNRKSKIGGIKGKIWDDLYSWYLLQLKSLKQNKKILMSSKTIFFFPYGGLELQGNGLGNDSVSLSHRYIYLLKINSSRPNEIESIISFFSKYILSNVSRQKAKKNSKSYKWGKRFIYLTNWIQCLSKFRIFLHHVEMLD